MKDLISSRGQWLRHFSFATHWKTMLLVLVLCVGFNANAQNLTVTGTVVDGTDEPMIGATVAVEGTKNLVVTDIDGNFTLKNVAKNATILVSYIGYKTERISVNGQTHFNVVLSEDSEALDEVVVIGYGGSRARRDLTGSVGSVSGAKLAAVPVTSAAVALQGKVAGVQVTTVDGQPGADINIRVRGATSVTQSNDPLYIVDGFQVENINDIPPSDIQSIDILKDASLTAIYGAKGGNGVVIVTTKSASQGKTTVSVNAYGSVSHLSKKLDLMDAYDFVTYQWDRATGHSTRNSRTRLFRYNFGHPYDLDLYKNAVTHDWQDEVMGNNPFSYSTNVAIGGGNDQTRFNVSVTQSEDKGIILGSGVRRTNITTKLSTKILPNLTFQFNPKMTYRRDEGAGGDNVGTGGIINVLKYRPTNGIREMGGYWDPNTVDQAQENIFSYTNPVNDIATNVRKKHAYTTTNQAALEYKPITDLTLRTDGTYSYAFSDDNRFYGPYTSEGKSNQTLPVAQIEKKQTNSWTWTTTASYDWSIKEKNNFYALVGFEMYHKQTSATTQKNRYFPIGISASKAWANMGLGTPTISSSSVSTAVRTTSYFGQLNYNYDHKYLLSATFRADGSTMFAKGHQWGYFPSISGAWVLSQENFLKDATWLSELKFRAAIGKAGNNNIDADMWRYLYTTSSNGGPGFNDLTTAEGDLYYSLSNYLPNKDIKWETTLTRNFAFDISLFNGRLRLSPEYYWNTTSDLIYKAEVLTTTGYANQYQNIGQVTNRGFELSVNGDILRGKDYVLSANFNLGSNKMKVDKLNSEFTSELQKHSRATNSNNYNYILEVGKDVGLIYGYVYDGLYDFNDFHITYSSSAPVYTPWERVTEVNGVWGEYDANGEFHAATVNMDGIYNSSPSGAPTLPGKMKFKDLNGDGIIDENDRTVIGRTTPKIQGGFGLSGQWKQFDFAANFTYFLDFDVYNATAFHLSSATGGDQDYYNVLFRFNNRWKYSEGSEVLYGNYWMNSWPQDQINAYYEAYNVGCTTWNPADVNKEITFSYFVEDGSFLRCNDITVGYSLPDRIIKHAGMSKCRFYATVSNPFIITNYSGYDPEVDIQSGLTPSYDYNRYPRSRSYVFGINLTF